MERQGLGPEAPWSALPPPRETARRRNPYIDLVAADPGVIQPRAAEGRRGRWREVCGFPPDAPLWVEFGCGSALFAAHLAERHPEALVLGVDRRYKRLYLAARRARRLANLEILRYDVEYVHHIFEGEVDRLYLIYPEPWPRKRDARNRIFDRLHRYRSILRPGSRIVLRTDSALVRRVFEAAVSATGGTAVTKPFDRSGRADLSAFDLLFEHKGAPATETVAHLGPVDPPAAGAPDRSVAVERHVPLAGDTH